MKNSVAGGAAALLQKSRSQTRGQHVMTQGRVGPRNATHLREPQPSKKNEDEDDIAAYLSQISKKTSGVRHEMDELGSGLSDLSASDDDRNTSALKFMKKSSRMPSGPSKSAPSISQSGSMMKGMSAGPMQKNATKSFTSSALERASKLNAKISSRKIVVDSESSEGLDDIPSSPDTPEGAKEKYRFMKKPIGKSLERSAINKTEDRPPKSKSQENYLRTAGFDKHRFMKKPSSKSSIEKLTSEADDVPFSTKGQEFSLQTSEPDQDKYRFMKKSSKPQESHLRTDFESRNTGGSSAHVPMTSTPVRSKQETSSNSRNVYSKLMAELDSDEDNMEDLIGDMDSSRSKVESPVRFSPEQHHIFSEEDKSQQRIPSEGPNPVNTGYTQSVIEFTQSVTSSDSSIAEDIGGLTLAGLQTIDDLMGTAIPSPEPKDSFDDKQRIPSPRHSIPSRLEKSIRTVEDSVSSISTVHDDNISHSIATDHSYTSVASYTSIPESRSHSGSQSHSKSRSSRSRRHRRSNSSDGTSISSHASHSTSARSYTSDRTSTRSLDRANVRSTSSDRTITSQTGRRRNNATHPESVTYSHDFDDVTSDDDQTLASDFSTSHAESIHRSHRSRKHRGHDAAVQTTPSVNDHWIKDYDFQSDGYFRLLRADINERVASFVEPKVLQTLGSFDSSALLLHANLAEQVRQTQLAITNTMRQHQAFLDSLKEDYSYTTLETTKLFIKRQKKKRRQRESPDSISLS